MEEAEFNDLADAELMRIEAAAENCGASVEVRHRPGGVLEIVFDDGTRFVVNRHAVAQEIRLDVHSGALHFSPREGGWVCTEDGSELYETLSRLISEQSGEPVKLVAE